MRGSLGSKFKLEFELPHVGAKRKITVLSATQKIASKLQKELEQKSKEIEMDEELSQRKEILEFEIKKILETKDKAQSVEELKNILKKLSNKRKELRKVENEIDDFFENVIDGLWRESVFKLLPEKEDRDFFDSYSDNFYWEELFFALISAIRDYNLKK